MLLWSFEGARGIAAAGASTISAVIAAGIHLFPFRTEKLSPPAPMVLGGQPPGRVGRRPVFDRIEDPRAGILDRAYRRRRSLRRHARAVQSAGALRRAAAPRLARMELRDGDLVLRPWTEDDVAGDGRRLQRPRGRALDPDVPLAVHRGRTRSRSSAARFGPTDQALAIELDGRVVGGIGMGAQLARATAATHRLLGRGARAADAASARARCGFSSRHALDELERPAGRAHHRSGQHRVAACRREGRLPARRRPSCAPPPPDGRIRDSVMFSLLPGELRE